MLVSYSDLSYEAETFTEFSPFCHPNSAGNVELGIETGWVLPNGGVGTGRVFYQPVYPGFLLSLSLWQNALNAFKRHIP